MTHSMNQKVREGYNQAAAAYTNTFRNQFKNNSHLDLLIQRLKNGDQVLDLGCGGGKPIDSYLVEQGFKVTGIDISEEQIKLAQQNVPAGNFMVCDMSELTANQFQVDAVVCFYAIFHIPKEQHLQVLKLMRTFLKPGGSLLLTMGASEWEGKEDDFCGAEMYWSHYGEERNVELVKEAGFTLLFHEIDTTGDERHLIVLAEAN